MNIKYDNTNKVNTTRMTISKVHKYSDNQFDQLSYNRKKWVVRTFFELTNQYFIKVPKVLNAANKRLILENFVHQHNNPIFSPLFKGHRIFIFEYKIAAARIASINSVNEGVGKNRKIAQNCPKI